MLNQSAFGPPVDGYRKKERNTCPYQGQSLQERFVRGTPFFTWRRKWQPTPVFLPGKSHGLRIRVGYSPWGCKELDTTEQLHFHFHFLVGLWFILVNFCGRNDFCLSPFSIMLPISFFFLKKYINEFIYKTEIDPNA